MLGSVIDRWHGYVLRCPARRAAGRLSRTMSSRGAPWPPNAEVDGYEVSALHLACLRAAQPAAQAAER